MSNIRPFAFLAFIFLLSISLFGQESPYLFEVKEILIPYRSGSQWGYCDAGKQMLIPVQYEEAGFFQEGYAIVKQDGQYHLINEAGGLASERGYARIRYRPGRGYELFDTPDGKGYPARIREGRLELRQDGREEASLAELEWATQEATPLAEPIMAQAGIYKEGDKYGFRSGYAIHDPATGTVQYDWDHLIPPIYDSIAALGPNQLAVLENGKWGIVGPDNEVQLEKDYDHLSWVAFWGNRAYLVSRAGHWGIISRAFEPIIPVEYDTLALAGQLILAAKEGRWGVLDTYGQPVLPLQYEALQHTVFNRDDYFFAKKSGRWGVLKGAGKLLLGFDYIGIKAEAGPYFMVHDGLGWGLVNEQGESILPCEYDGIELEYIYGLPAHPGYRLFRDGKAGFFSPTFNKLFHPQYLDFRAFQPNNLAKVETAAGSGYISWQGVEYFE